MKNISLNIQSAQADVL